MKFKIYKVCIVTLCIIFWLIIAIAHNSSHFKNTRGLNDFIIKTFPQGWGFFTKDPRNEFNYKLYTIKFDTIDEQITHRNGSSFSHFGISKNNRRCFYEIGIISNNFKLKDWENFKGKIICVPEKSSSVSLDKDELNLSCILKGVDYVLVRSKTIPFAWSNQGQDVNKPNQIVRFRAN